MSFASSLNLAGKRMTGNTVRTQNGNSFYSVSIFKCTLWLDSCSVALAPGVSNVLVTSIGRFLTFELIVILFSVLAASSIANIVKSSLGPVGLDKMLVDDVGVWFFLLVVALLNQLMLKLLNLTCRMSQSRMMELPFLICLRLNTQQPKY